MEVTEQGFAAMTKQIVNLAGEICSGRLLVALEGGYNLRGLRDGVLAVLGELTGNTQCPGKVNDAELRDIIEGDGDAPIIEKVRDIAKRYWNL